MVQLVTAEIDRFGPLKSCHPDCGDGITVIGGPNESGKTLYLEALLQLLDPGVMDHMDPAPRVEGAPTGRVIVDDGSDQHTLGEGTALSDITAIEPINLHNLFVVRDSDLALPAGTGYYTRLVEQLGDIHTTAINQLRGELVSEGRLTKRTLNLANREYDTKDVRKETKALAEDIEEYLASISADDISASIRERVRKRRELQDVREQLQTQRTAKRLHDIEFAREQLSTYRSATADIQELEQFDRDTLIDLRELKQDITRDEEQETKLTEQFNEKQTERDEVRGEISDIRTAIDELQQREADVEIVEETLEAYREQKRESAGPDDQLRLRRSIAIAGIGGAAILGGIGAAIGSSGAIVLGFVLFVAGLGGWYLHRQETARLTAAEERESELIESARDAGFDIGDPADVAPAIKQYRDELDGARETLQRLQAEESALEERIKELEGGLESVQNRLQENREELDSQLAEADVDYLGEFEELVDRREGKEDDRSGAERDLRREIGEPDADGPEGKIDYWASEIYDLEDAVGEATVDVGDYDESLLDELEARESSLNGRVEELTEELSEFRQDIEEFERKANDLAIGPHVESRPSLQAHTVEGLEALAADLRDVVETIEENADISRRAINILDSIRDEEQEKIATLFDPDGPASSILSNLTDGRYEAVDYDPEAETLEVTTATGQQLNPHQLSRGTKDQLFLAARLSLAQQILGNQKGFLLLDDPFLAADPSRLRRGFEILQDLTTEGWQIIYLTAKEEVRESVVDEFELNLHELEMLEF